MHQLEHVDVAVITEDQAVGAGAGRRARDDDRPTNQAITQATGKVVDGAIFEDDGVLDFAVLDGAVMVDRCKRADIRIDDARAFADDGGATDGAVDDFGAFFDDDFADDV